MGGPVRPPTRPTRASTLRASSETFTYGNDVHGSVSQLITEGGTVKASYGYDAYGGEDAALTTGDLDDRSPINPYRFQNDRLDSGSATATKPATSVDMGARRFGVDTGRFLQQDMFADALGDLALSLDPLTQNSYALAGGDPVSFVEVDGHMLMVNGGGGGSPDPNPTPRDDEPSLLDKVDKFVKDLGECAQDDRDRGRQLPVRDCGRVHRGGGQGTLRLATVATLAGALAVAAVTSLMWRRSVARGTRSGHLRDGRGPDVP